MRDIFVILTYALMPVVTAAAGASLAALRPPGPRVRSGIQHFAAGVVFCVVAVDLLPHVIRVHGRMAALEVVVGFALGVAAMLGIRALTGEPEGQSVEQEGRWPVAMLVAIGVDVFVDGFLIGIGFAAGAREGELLTLALAIELLSLGLATSVALRKAGIGRAKTVTAATALTMLIPVGALLGTTLISRLSEEVFVALLAFGLAALLFLVTEELLTEAHEVPETPLITAAFFAGFLIFLVIAIVS